MTAYFPPSVHDLPPPQAKTANAKPYKAVRDLDRCPVPFLELGPRLVADPDFLPPPPAGDVYPWQHLPRKKIRGLGPADSLILRYAIRAGLVAPANILLAPLVPWQPPGYPKEFADADRNLLNCPDAPLQPDFISLVVYPMARWRPGPQYAPPPPDEPQPAYTKQPHPYIVEVKPNAGYVAFGQVLCYHHAWIRLYGADWPLRPAILTDLPRPYMIDLCAAYGVSIITLGYLLVEPPPWPT